MSGRKLSNSEVSQPPPKKVPRYHNKKTTNYKANAKFTNNSKNYRVTSSDDPLGSPTNETPLIKLKRPIEEDVMDLQRYFRIYRYESCETRKLENGSIQTLVDMCIGSKVKTRDACTQNQLSSCCFQTDTQTAQKYQTAQMIGLGIRLREMM